MEMRTKKLKQVFVSVILSVVVLTAFSLGVAMVNAQESAPPVLPCSFYGNITIDEKPAPVGTEITAKMDNKTYGNITVTEEGRYGGAGGFDPKLVVVGTAEDENKNVSFYVDGAKAEENATWNSGGVRYLDLSVKKAGAGPSPSLGPGATPTAGKGVMPMAVVIGIALVIVVAVALIIVGLKMRKR